MRPALALAAVVLGAGACALHTLDYSGLACDDGHACPAGYVCASGACQRSAAGGGQAGGGTGGGALGGGAGGGSGGGSGGGGVDAGCPTDVDPAANACSGTTWYLSPTGSDSADGKSPAAARLTLSGLTVQRGDTVSLLGGTYTQVPSFAVAMSGTASCPLLITGEADGGTVLQKTLSFNGAYFVFRHLVFSPQNEDAVTTDNANHVTFQFVTFRARLPGSSSYPRDLYFPNSSCSDCVVRESLFDSADGVAVLASDSATARLSFFGNVVHMQNGAGFSFTGPALVEANDFSGTFDSNNGYLGFGNSGDARVLRNVFHDITDYYPNKVLLSRPTRVGSNTFARISGNDSVALVVGAGRFDDNLVTVAQWVVNAKQPDAGDYNVFDPSVLRPYSDFDGGALNGTDRIAAVDFDPNGYVPAAGSAAIDSADPSLDVPPGGGARADVGAFERGAQRLADGLYCLPDGGNP